MNTTQCQPQASGAYWNPTAWFPKYDAACKASDDKEMASLNMHVASTTNEFLDKGFVVQEMWPINGVGTSTVTTIRAPMGVPKSRQVDTIEPMRCRPQFPQTTVHVVNMDCITATYQLQNMYRGSKCVCLNMANQFSCGGGWLHGKLAQEESLFFRTNISRGLSQIRYPFGDYTSIFTSDVVVFRESYQRGYEFLQESGQFCMNFVTAAAFNLYDSRTQQEIIPADDFITKTRLKIESFFALCANENASVLVLGAFGCGAFRNPPFLVANLFKSVIEQYAGYFQEITFCIHDNPTSTKIIDFARTLVDPGITAVPIITTLDQQVPFKTYAVCPCFGPNPNPPDVLRKSVCPSGGRCAVPDMNHFMSMIHPPFCPYGDSCMDTSEIHRSIYAHFNSNPQSQPQPQLQSTITSQFQLPPQPQPQPQSQPLFPPPNSSKQFQSQPNFKSQSLFSPQNYNQQSHFQSTKINQQCRSRCEPHKTDKGGGALCRNPFTCPIALNKKDPDFVRHTREFMHVCRFGTMCEDNSPEHLKQFYHMKKPMCKDGPGCKKTRIPKHRFKYFHKGLTDFMLHCNYNPCNKYGTSDHRMNCYHNNQESFVPTMEYLKKCGIELKLVSMPRK